jgi:uncharacterized protein YcnI
MLRRLGAVTLLAALGLLVFAPSAWAHVELEPAEAIAGSTQTLTFSVAFEGAATTGLDVELPEGASVTQVPAKAGWTASVDDPTRTVSWTGGSVAQDDSFSVVVQLPETTGEVLFPAIQHTTDGEVAWISPEATEGEEGNPAPRLTLTADPNATTTSTEASTTTTVATTTTELPGTTLEAEERDDGSNSAAPWLIGSAIVALLAILIGGLLLKRRSDREKAEAAATAASANGAPSDRPSGDGAGGGAVDGGPDGP